MVRSVEGDILAGILFGRMGAREKPQFEVVKGSPTGRRRPLRRVEPLLPGWYGVVGSPDNPQDPTGAGPDGDKPSG